MVDVKPSLYKATVHQIKARARCYTRTQLHNNLIFALRTPTEQYYTQKTEDERLKKTWADAAAKTKAEKIAIPYPLLSEIIDSGDNISLHNPTVEQWTRSALNEVVQLHMEINMEISHTSTNNRDTSFLPVPRSSDCNNFVIKDSKTQ